MRTIAVIGALAAVAVLVAGPNAAPVTKPSVELAFDRGGWIYLAQDDGTAARRLTRGSGAAFSPDGSRLAFARSDRLYVVRADGTGERELTLAGRGYGVKWSPDGRRVAFTSHYRSGWRPNAAMSATSAVSRAAPGGLIAFARRTGTGSSALYVLRSDGSGLRRISSEPVDSDPAWTPDGNRLVFSSSRGGRAGAAELYTRDVAGTSVVRITNTPKSTRRWAANVEPTVTADGKRVIFVQERYGGTSTRDLYSVAISGGPLRRITRTTAREASPATGRSHAIYFERDGWIYEMALGVTRRIARGVQPAKDPSNRGLVAFARAGAIFVSWGGTPVRIAQGNSSGGFSEPAWSPDGSRLVFVSPDGLFTVARDGSDLRRLTKTPSLAHDLAPAWQPERGAR